jgi:hypothetical protein
MSLAMCTSAFAQQAEGDWLGTLKTPASELRLAVHIRKDAQGIYQASMDSLDQSALGIRVASVAANNGSLVLEIPDLGARYEARWDATAGQWKGTFIQRGTSLPLNLSPENEHVEGDGGSSRWYGLVVARHAERNSLSLI